MTDISRFATSVLLLSLVACGEKSSTNEGAPAGASSAYHEAAAAGVARGDSALAAGDTASALAIWGMLAGFDSTNTVLAKRLQSVPARGFAVSVDEVRWVDRVVKSIDDTYWCEFPERTPESDLTNLRMLGDAQLLPTLRTAGLRAPAGKCDNKDAFLPLAPPVATIADLRERYGAPTAEVTKPNGSVVITYGRFRLFGDKDGKIIAVVMPSFVK